MTFMFQERETSADMDHATTMLDLDVFRTRLRPGIEYVGREMGCNMDIKREAWVCPTSRIMRVRLEGKTTVLGNPTWTS